MSVLNDDVNQLERFLDGGANSLIQLSTTVLAVGAIFFWVSSVAWVAFLPMPLIVWGSIYYQRKLQARYVDVRKNVGALNADLAGNLGGIATIKSYAREEAEASRIDEQSEYRAATAGPSPSPAPSRRSSGCSSSLASRRPSWWAAAGAGRRPRRGRLRDPRLHDPAAPVAADLPRGDAGPLPEPWPASAGSSA